MPAEIHYAMKFCFWTFAPLAVLFILPKLFIFNSP